MLCTVYLERVWELVNYSNKVYYVLELRRKYALIGEAREALIAPY